MLDRYTSLEVVWKLIRVYLLFFLQILQGCQHKKNYIKVMKKYSVTHIKVILGFLL